MNRKEIVKHITETANEVRGAINAYERKAGHIILIFYRGDYGF
jgi:hypothetical protein